MPYDAHKNFAISTVAVAPSPDISGTSIGVAATEGSRFPAAPFNAVVWPVGAQPTVDTAEIVRVTAISVDTFTVIRGEESTAPRAIIVGDQICAAITVRTLTDIENVAGVTVYEQPTEPMGAIPGDIWIVNP